MGTARDVFRGTNNINFQRLWRFGGVFSLILVVASAAGLATSGLNLGIDFEGGVAMEVAAPGVSLETVRDQLGELGEGNAKIQTVGTEIVRVQTGDLEQAMRDEIRSAIAQIAGVDPAEVSVSVVGPSWGREITDSAVRALVWFLLVISLYMAVRLEWRMAAGALAALAHDVLVTVGVYAVFGFEVTPSTVIAFLTILGYSLYDTIVVFDKVHQIEDRSRGRETYGELMSRALNAVLLRTLNTTTTSLLPVVSMLVIGDWIMGVVTLRDFALALLVGMLVGAYSSVFVASPIVVLLRSRTQDEKHRRARAERTSRLPSAPGIAGADGSSLPGSGQDVVEMPELFSTGHPPRPRKMGKRR